MLSTVAPAFRAVLSPQKNPCRVRIAPLTTLAASTFRYDPYVTKVVPSPFKTPLTPTTFESEPEIPPMQMPPMKLHQNSLFNPVSTPVVTESLPIESPTARTGAPTSELAKGQVQPAVTHYAIVRFKHDSATYIAPFRIAPGDYVFVQGDRGEDIGMVAEITTETPAYPVPCKIVRRASTRDKEQLNYKMQKEEGTVKAVQQMADSIGMSIRIVDTEFQFDMNKLTVFFESKSGHIDFRKLQRGLFREYRCRIWLSNIAEVEYNNKMQQIRRTR